MKMLRENDAGRKCWWYADDDSDDDVGSCVNVTAKQINVEIKSHIRTLVRTLKLT
jgi:hypothetical protein